MLTFARKNGSYPKTPYACVGFVMNVFQPRSGVVMNDNSLTYEQLVGRGWSLNDTKGVSSEKFTSLSFCLTSDSHRLVCVQGYGRTRNAALNDAVHRANWWERRERLQSGRGSSRSGQLETRGRLVPPSSPAETPNDSNLDH